MLTLHVTYCVVPPVDAPGYHCDGFKAYRVMFPEGVDSFASGLEQRRGSRGLRKLFLEAIRECFEPAIPLTVIFPRGKRKYKL